MSFASLASNQMVNEADASTGGFTSIGAKNPANQCYTKTQALAAYNLSPSLMASYAGNQLVPKSVWATGVVSFSYPIAQAGGTASEACGYNNFVATFYSNVSTLVVGSIWYSDPGLTTPVTGGSGTPAYTWHQVQGSGNSYRVGPTGVIEVITSCSSVFVPYSYSGQIQSVSTGPTFQFTFQIRIDTFGAPAWNTITGGTVSITQGSSNTNGITNILHLSGTLYQCNTIVGVVSNTVNATITLCGIGVSNGVTSHTHTFAVPVTFTPTEIGNGASKSVTVNVT